VLRSVPKKEAETGEAKEKAVFVSKVSGQVFQGLNANLPPPIFIPSKRAMSGPVLTRLDPAPIHVRGSEDFAPVNYAQQVLATKVEEQRQEYRSRPQPKQVCVIVLPDAAAAPGSRKCHPRRSSRFISKDPSSCFPPLFLSFSPHLHPSLSARG
jgi:hypothetical protein